MVSRLSSIRQKPDWRSSFFWPLQYPELRARIKLWCDNYADYCAFNEASNEFNLLSLSSVLIIPETTKIIWLATVAHAFDETLDELSALQPTDFDKLAKIEDIKFASFKRKARELTLNVPTSQKFGTFNQPKRLVISHNSILRNAAMNTPGIFRYHHASSILKNQRFQGNKEPQVEQHKINRLVCELEQTFVRSLDGLCYQIIELARQKFREFTFYFLSKSEKDIFFISDLKLPFDEIWLGTAGYYPARLIALHSKTIQSKTVSFDHGGSSFMVKYPSNRYIVDISVVDQLVLPNQNAVENFQRINAGYFNNKLRIADVVSGYGDSYYKRVSQRQNQVSKNQIQALYCLTLLGGRRQNQPTLLPDLVALDLQFTVVSWLQSCGIIAKIKPHPATNLDGLSEHPLSEVAEVLNSPFEKIMRDAEMFIFDYAQSTTFWAALCTEKPVILIDTKITEFDKETRDLLNHRCLVIDTKFDERGRCIPDQDQFTKALQLARSQTRFDASSFIKLLS